MNNLNEYNKGKGKWVVLYYATWCGYCQDIMPIWNNFKNQKNKIKKIEIESNDISKLNYNPEIMGFPSIHLYKDGKLLKKFDKKRTLANLNKFVIEKKKKSKKKYLN